MEGQSEYAKEAEFRQALRDFRVSACKHWAILWGGVAVTAILATIGVYAGAQVVPMSTVLVSLTLIVSAFMAFWDQWKEAKTLKKDAELYIEAKHDREIPGCVVDGGDRYKVFRLQLTNTGRKAALRVELTQVCKDDLTIWEGHAAPLVYSGSEADGTPHIKDLYPNAPVFLDVLWVPGRGSTKQFMFGVKDGHWIYGSTLPRDMFDSLGDFTLTLRILSDTVTIQRRCVFKWNGDAETATMRMLEG